MAPPPVSEAHKVEVDKVKAEGDALFTQKRFKEAYVKYSDAIKLDGNNAILYANRAASALSTNEYVLHLHYVHRLFNVIVRLILHVHSYLDAASDAKYAVKLNPSYYKAWARLGKAEHASCSRHDIYVFFISDHSSICRLQEATRKAYLHIRGRFLFYPPKSPPWKRC
jgi:tetratricopeptide (TPR) repeat protein